MRPKGKTVGAIWRNVFFLSAKSEAYEKKISARNTPLCPVFKQLCEDVILKQWQPSCDREATSMRKNKKAKILMTEEVKGKMPAY